MAKIITLADIAKKMNVSTVTVSKALSGKKGVSEALRAEIVEMAEEMGYVRKKDTPEFKKRKSYNIGVITAERYLKEKQSFYWQLYQDISQTGLKRNCFAILEVVTPWAEKEAELPVLITERKVNGLVVMGTFHREYIERLSAFVSVPLVFLDTTVGVIGGDFVVSDNLMGGYRMTNYLFQMGHRNIAFVGTRLATPSIDDRFLGYLKSLMEHGVPWKKQWFIDDRDEETGEINYHKKLVLPKEMPTAFFCNCDLTADLFIGKLEAAGYQVPKDISVTGFDNYSNGQSAKIGITTIEINTKEMAKRTIHILMNKIGHLKYSTGTFTLSGRLVERGSVKRIGAAVPVIQKI